MAGMTSAIRQSFLKFFPTVQQRALVGLSRSYLTGVKLAPLSLAAVTQIPDADLVIPQVMANVPYAVTGTIVVSSMTAANNLQFNFGNSTAVIQSMSIQTQFYTALGVVTQGSVAVSGATVVSGGTAAVNVAVAFSGVVTFSSGGSFGMNLYQVAAGPATVVDVGSFLQLEATLPTGS